MLLLNKMADVSKLVYSILKFLGDQKTSGNLSDDAVESLEVAIQCLESAYGINTNEPESASKYYVDKNLLDIFNSHTSSEKTDNFAANTLHEPTPEDRVEAEKLKNKGNDFMKAEKFSEALECYTKAIKLDNKNAVYYCNRAAAYSKLTKHTSAIQDCNSALAIDPSYSKAYGRMGMAYLELENNEQSHECYRKALELDPNNQSYKNNLEMVEQRLREQAMGAANLMSNPQMQSMMSNLMSSAAGEGSNGGLTSLLQAGQQLATQMQQQNPDLVAQLRRQANILNGEQQTNSEETDNKE
ncbi:small glutamine-rich tetratricopeptide repeat-containing protein alpha isoform X2 [Octopus bimaculoides]|uniref:small glutamine-rich tetratricopeptide repeat-containing protein alpha isoform X2 n=1 Tax=Octopus bimaculoides TaxID=37653 RepID=UPI0022E0FAAA|nr:small glutamine-rich tetratricopeptide repeat-containing protein alpha isoform X2 [Octopus bimaculoides]